MKKGIAKYVFLLLLLGSCEALISFNPQTTVAHVGDDKDAAILSTILHVLRSGHYQPKQIDDQLSSQMFDAYIESIDYNKRFLTKKDYQKLEKYRYLLDDQINQRNFEFFDLSNELITERIGFVSEFYQGILKKPVDLEDDKQLELDPKKLDFVDSKSDLKKRWCDYMTYNVFSNMYTAERKQNEKAEKSDTVTIKTQAQLEEKARETVLKNHEQWFTRLKQTDRDDRIALYFNSLTAVFDPHTNFYPPKDKEDFDISMSGKLEGIGATLQQKDGYIKVTRIVPGSASWKQGGLKSGDMILEVAQGEEEPVSIVDMRLDEAVRLIRGPKGTEVRLTVRKINEEETIVPIIRDVVVLEETYAKSAVVEDKETGTKTGYLYLPKFYADFQNPKGRRCSQDVKKEVLKLKKEGVDGIVIDLRNNGGGSLSDVVKIAGLFIKDGPIVQVKAKGSSPYVLDDRDRSIVYAGPLVILINESSASASEILAAAMQDYKRAIVMGSTSSYGKGTVQRFQSLDDILSDEAKKLSPLGDIKYTMQKFYRINGGATQLKGVESDIVTPDDYKYIEVGEKEMTYPMVWDEIQKASYDDYSSYVGDLEKIKANSYARIKADSVFSLYDQRAMYFKQVRDSRVYPLSYSAFKTQMDQDKKEGERFETKETVIESIQIKALTDDVKAWGSDTSKTASFDEFSEKISKDHYIYQATKVVEDIIQY